MSFYVRKPNLGFSFCRRSLSELTKSRGNATDGVLGVGEWRSVFGSPRELGADAGHNLLFLVGIGSEVTDFLLHGLHALNAGAEFDHLLDGHLGSVSDVVHHLELSQMSHVVGQVQLEIPLHGNVEGLHLFGGSSATSDGGLNRESGSEEAVVLSMEFVNNIGGVDVSFVIGPVDLSMGNGCLVRVVVVEDGGKLSVGFTGLTTVSSCSKTSQPVVGQFVC